MINKLPAEYLDSIKNLLGDSYPDFFEALDRESYSGIRLNTQKTNSEILDSSLVSSFTPLSWEESGYAVKPATILGKHPFHASGLYYLQEPSAMVPVYVLDPQPGDKILDLCAAPGGKTTQIYGRMQGDGILVANDPNPRRVQALVRNVERWGGKNISILSEKPERLAAHFGPYFDRVLVDAPCSGEGTFRAHPGEIKKWSPGLIKRSAAIQDEILWYASKMLRPGGVLVYSTCTFNQTENEGTISRFLTKDPSFKLEKIPYQSGFSPGIPLPDYEEGEIENTIRIWPHLAQGEGHFIARLRKDPEGEISSFPGNLSPAQSNPQMILEYQDFFSTTIRHNHKTNHISPESGQLQTIGNQIFWLPPEGPALSGLNVLRWGFLLGSSRGGGFIPSSSLAASVTPEDTQKVIEFSIGDPSLMSYMRGSPIPSPKVAKTFSGWVLISVGGFSLGWGKVQGEKIKSHFPSWLRLR